MTIGQMISVMAAGMVCAGALAAQPGGDEDADLVVPSVIAEASGVAPGGTVWVGVHFEIKDGWHTYWPGQNDTGLGTGITVTAPDGVTVGEPNWPAPHRYVANGGILDHVHEHAVTALIPVTAPSDAPVGSTIELSFDLEWLVCEEVCIPGWETVSLTIPVQDAPVRADGTAAETFERARWGIPKPNDGLAEVIWKDGRATITSPGASRVLFYPDERGSRVVDLLASGDRKGDSLTLAFEDDDPTLSGVLEIRSDTGEATRVILRSGPTDSQ